MSTPLIPAAPDRFVRRCAIGQELLIHDGATKYFDYNYWPQASDVVVVVVLACEERLIVEERLVLARVGDSSLDVSLAGGGGVVALHC